MEVLSSCSSSKVRVRLERSSSIDRFVDKVSDLTYTIQLNPESGRFNVHVDHLKPYLGENSPQP